MTLKEKYRWALQESKWTGPQWTGKNRENDSKHLKCLCNTSTYMLKQIKKKNKERRMIILILSSQTSFKLIKSILECEWSKIHK